MKIMRLKLFQETACYKKPFAFKVAETYPLPPYSTVIGMFHKILQAKSGEYFPMNISIQGEFESIFSNYQNLRMYKGKDEVIDKIYNNIINGEETFTLGRNEDLVRIDEVKIINQVSKIDTEIIIKHNAYVPTYLKPESGISYRLNTKYTIVNELRRWEKVNVKYVENNNFYIENGYLDGDGEVILWCYEDEVN